MTTSWKQNNSTFHMDRFVASVEKGKSVGREPVNEEIVEDLLQRIEQSSKKSLRKLSLQADVPLEKT
jgi:hypothetical protein